MTDAETMAIQAHNNLISLGYEEEIGPLRLSNRRGATAILLASITAVIYGISGFFFGIEANPDIATGSFFFHFLDALTITAFVTAGLSLCFAILGFMKKHTSKITPIVALTVLLTAPLVLHILGVILGLMVQ